MQKHVTCKSTERRHLWLIFRARKYNVMNKQTDTAELFSGH